MPAAQTTHVATEAFHILRTLYQLSTDLFSSEDRQDLVFRILNGTIRLFPYRRAVLWSFDEKKPKLLGVSGQEDVNEQSPTAGQWKAVVSSIENKQVVQVLNGTSAKQEAWQGLTKKTSGLSVMWVPMTVNGKLRAGLWLERWGKDVWEQGESEIMNSFAQNLSLAWKQYNPAARWKNKVSKRYRRTMTALAAVALVCLLYFLTVSLRIVAPCEIVPEEPKMIAAPLEGVIRQVWVQPGNHVKQGDLLFTYEDRIVIQDLKVAQKEVEIIKSQYDRLRLKAFYDDKAMEEVRSLEYRLEQEKIRLKLAESNAKHLEVRAPIEGTCMLDDPEKWQGRPVQIGERVIEIFVLEKKKVKIFLPENDYIQFDRDKPIWIILNAEPGSKYKAWLSYVSPKASKSPKGVACFVAEAFLADSNPGIRIGSKGSAIISGEEVPVGYWLFRKPLTGVRRLLGF